MAVRTPSPPPPEARLRGRLAGRIGPDGAAAFVLFVLLAALSWRRWASFDGDLNREWTTPARVAAGERLYRDVSWYYGPLVPWVEGAVFRAAGSRVGTAVAVDLAAAGAFLALLLAAGRRFLPPAGRVALAAAAAGGFAFAPDNGALVACYSQSALWAAALSWLAFLLSTRGRGAGAAAAGAAALLSKIEALPALVVAGAFLPGRRRLAFGAGVLLAAGAGYALACGGIPLAELVRYGPLRHFDLPPEFRELYLRISGLHPALLPRAARGAAAGALLAGGWLLAAGGLLAARPVRAAAGGGLLAAALLLRFPGEPVLTTATRGLALLAAGAALLGLARSRDARLPEEERARSGVAAGAALVGLSLAWRTALWMVPSLPYAPLAALSCLPAAAWLAAALAPEAVPAGRRGRAAWILAAPLVAAPLAFLPRLVSFYRSPRTEVVAPGGTWIPPGAQGELFSRLVAHLSRAGATGRPLVVLPEAGALGFLLGSRSPLRLEQALPGHLDDAADADAAARLRESRPERVVVIPRPTGEFGGALLGRDYGRRLMAALAEGWEPEVTYRAFAPGEVGPERAEATVFRRKPGLSPAGRAPGS